MEQLGKGLTCGLSKGACYSVLACCPALLDLQIFQDNLEMQVIVSILLCASCCLKHLKLLCMCQRKRTKGKCLLAIRWPSPVQASESQLQGRKGSTVRNLPSGREAQGLVEKRKRQEGKHISEFLKQLSHYKTCCFASQCLLS